MGTMHVRHFLLKTSLFIVALVGFNRLLGMMFSKGWENQAYHKKRELFLDRYASDCNSVFYGSSRTYAHIDPLMFDSLNALSGLHTDSYMLASSTVYFNEMHYQISELFKDRRAPRNLKYLFVELDDYLNLDAVNLYTPRAIYFITPQTIVKFLKRLYADNRPPVSLKYQTSFYLSSMLVHFFQSGYGRAKLELILKPSLTVRDSLWIKGRGHVALSIHRPEHQQGEFLERYKDFMRDTSVIRQNVENIAALDNNTNKDFLINPLVLDGYLNLISDMQVRGIRVIIVLPIRRGIDNRLKGLYKALPDGHKIDMSRVAIQIPELHYTSHWFDRGHLNIDGVRLYTQAFSREVQKLNTAFKSD